MNILVTGASGFIAAQIVSALLTAGHHVTCCVRNTHYAQRIFPNSTILSCDFINDTSPQHWIPRLQKISIVHNNVIKHSFITNQETIVEDSYSQRFFYVDSVCG